MFNLSNELSAYRPRYTVKRIRSHPLAWLTSTTYNVMYDEDTSVFSSISRDTAYTACDLLNTGHRVGFFDCLSSVSSDNFEGQKDEKVS